MLSHAWRNLEFNISKTNVNQPSAQPEAQEAAQQQNEVSPSPNLHGNAPEPKGKKQTKNTIDYKKYASYITRFFRAAWAFLTTHHGFISAVATLAIAVLTIYYVKYAKKQWEAMNEQLVEMRKTTKAAQDSVDLARKQMEGVSAAIVQLRSGGLPDVYVGAPPWGGQVRFGFTNYGHVNAHKVHVKFTATLHSVLTGSRERELVSGEDEIQFLPPVSANVPNPDLMFDFRTDPKRIVDTYKEFIIVKGSFSYENGFNGVFSQGFCQGYVWGPNKVGRLFPRCGTDITNALKAVREATQQ